KYLENAPGAPSRNVVGMARRGLRLDLRSALSEAVETRQAVRRPGIRVELEDRIQVVDVAIEPLPDHDVEPLFLVIFCDVGTPLSPDRMLPALTDELTASTEHLEGELRDARERLQSIVEEYETALEELKSANEELVDERGIAIDQRGAGDLARGGAIGQRGAQHRQQRIAAQGRGDRPGQRKSAKPVRRHRDRHGVSRQAAGDPQLHAGDQGHL